MKETSVVAKRVIQYRTAVCTFAYYLALVSLIGERVERGELTDKTALTDALDSACRYKMKFFSARKILGLKTDEKSALAAFQEDFFFNGFRITGGKLDGDMECVEKVVGKWVIGTDKIPTEEEAVRYEVSIFAMMLAGGSQAVFTALGEDKEAYGIADISTDCQKETKKLKKRTGTGFFTKIKSFFSGPNDPKKRRKVWESAWEEEEDERVA